MTATHATYAVYAICQIDLQSIVKGLNQLIYKERFAEFRMNYIKESYHQ